MKGRIYTRICSKCNKEFRTFCKRGKICSECLRFNNNREGQRKQHFPTENIEVTDDKKVYKDKMININKEITDDNGYSKLRY